MIRQTWRLGRQLAAAQASAASFRLPRLGAAQRHVTLTAKKQVSSMGHTSVVIRGVTIAGFTTFAIISASVSQANVEHQLGYLIQGYHIQGTVVVRDAFMEDSHPFSGPRIFSAPVRKNQEPYQDTMAHYTWYDLESPRNEPIRWITYTNQFGEGVIKLFNPKYLLVPALRDPSSEDQPPLRNHFRCYDSVGDGPSVNVTLATPFGTHVVLVLEVSNFCSAAALQDANGFTPVPNPEDHLVCYNTASSIPVGQSVALKDSLQPNDTAKAMARLCPILMVSALPVLLNPVQH